MARDLLPPIFAWLSSDSEVGGIVSSRIWRHGTAPQASQSTPINQPYITWFINSGTPENNLSDRPPVDRMGVQIDCWHQTDDGVVQLATAVRDVMEGYCHMTAIIANLREPDTRLYRLGMTFDVWHDRGRFVPD